MAARTVLGPKPCSTQAPTVLNVRSFGSSNVVYSLLGLENLPEQTPKSCRSYEAISVIKVMEMPSSDALLTVWVP